MLAARTRPFRTLSLAALCWLAASPLAATSLAAQPVRRSGQVFGMRAEIEVRDLPAEAGEAAILAAFAELRRVAAWTAPGSAELVRLESTQPQSPQTTPAEIVELLSRARDFCLWSSGLISPLGGRVYELWGLRQPVAARPAAEALKAAVETAGCDRLRVDKERGTVQVGAGSRLDLFGFEVGWAIDRAVETLRTHGARNAWVGVGNVQRGFGAGPAGAGWAVKPPRFPGLQIQMGRILLRDRALAVATPDDRPLLIAGDVYAPYFDLRSGRPAEGVVAVFISTQLAMDAQALSVAMFAAGTRQGQYLAGALRPRPAVLWLMGSGTGEPLFADYHWSDLKTER